MNVQIHPAAENLIERVAGMLARDGRDYSRTLVVFPGKRPRHFLLRRIAQEERAPFVPPVIHSIDTFVDFLFTDELGRIALPVNTPDAVALLHEIHRAQTRRYGGESFLPIDAFYPLGVRLHSELEELRIGDVTAERLHEAIGSVDLPELEYLPSLYESFYTRLEVDGRATRAMRYRETADAASALALPGFDRLIFAGFFSFTRAEARLIRVLLERDTTYFCTRSGPGLREGLAPLGIAVDDGFDAGAPDVRLTAAPNLHAQVFGLNTVLREARARGETLDERTVILLPDARALFPVIRNTGPLLDDPGLNISLGHPVTRTPVFGFLAAAFEALSTERGGRMQASAYLRFALHPYTKNILLGQRTDVTRILLHTIRDRVTRSTAASVSLDDIERDADLIEAVLSRTAGVWPEADAETLRAHLRDIHDHTLRRIGSARTLGELAEAVTAVLGFIDERGTARRHRYFQPFARTVMEAMDALRRSGLATAEIGERDRAFAVIRHCLADVTYPFPGTPLEGVQVLGTLEVRGLSFDRVCVLDANDDVFPGERGTGILLPPAVRDALGLSGRRDEERMKAYDFRVLTAGAKDLHFFFTSGTGREASREVERRLWEMEKRDGKAGSVPHIRPVTLRIDLANALPGPIEKDAAIAAALASPAFRYSASALDTYLFCQRKFHFRYALGLREREEAADEIDAAQIGSAVHRILCDFFGATRGRTLDASDCEPTKLAPVVRKALRETWGADEAGVPYLLRRTLEAQIRTFIVDYQGVILRSSAVEILAVEEEHTISDFHGALLFGRIDRIERRDGRIVISDYKTGNVKHPAVRFQHLDPGDRDTWETAINSTQLPAYLLLYRALHPDVALPDITAQYLWIGRSSIDATIELPLLPGDADPAECVAQLDSVLGALIDEIRDGTQPFLPPRKPEEACPTCAYRTLCGTGWLARR